MGWDNTEIGDKERKDGDMIVLLLLLVFGLPFYGTVAIWLYQIVFYCLF